MPLEFQKIDITLGTLAEGESAKRTLPGALAICENATFPKGGRIDKRRGYALVNVQTAVDGAAIDPANLFVNVATSHGELLVFGVDTLYGVTDRGSNLGDGALTSRGPTLRGGAEVMQVVTVQLSNPDPA